MKWLLQEDIFNENLESFVTELKKQKFDYKVIKYIPFNGLEDFTNVFKAEECVLFYGSLQLATQIKKKTKWIPGVYCDLPKFECSYYYPRLGNWLLNQNYIMLSYGDLKRRKEFLLDTLGEDGCVFVRPNSGFKIFTGKVIDSRTWDKDVDFLGFYDVTPETVVIVARPVVIQREFRLVITRQNVVSGGQYIKNKELKNDIAPKEVLDYGENLINSCNYSPDRAWCLDVCETNDELKVLEVGCFSCAGLYNLPKEPIVKEVSKTAIEEWNEFQ